MFKKFFTRMSRRKCDDAIDRVKRLMNERANEIDNEKERLTALTYIGATCYELRDELGSRD